MTGGFHVHTFEGPTTMNDRHRHFYRRKTTPELNVPGHVHNMSDITTDNHRHRHEIFIATGPSITVRNGHMHQYMGTTSYANGHVHSFKGYTSVSPN